MTHGDFEVWRRASLERIGAAISRARKQASLNQNELAEKIGTTRNAIQNLESRSARRSDIGLLELIQIAHALEIPPMLLIFPDMPDGPVELLPGIKVSSEKAASWFAEGAPIAAPNEYGVIEVYAANAKAAMLLELVRRRNTLFTDNLKTLRYIAQVQGEGLRPDIAAQIELLEREYQDLTQQISEFGGYVSDSDEPTG